MSRLKINFETPHFTADKSLLDYISIKLAKAENYFDNIQSIDVYLKLESHHQVKDKAAEIKLNVPGVTLFSSETSKTFEAATDLAVESLRRQLKKYKEKHKINY